MKKSARQIAFEILNKIESASAYSNIAIDSAVKVYNPNSTDCAFISRLVYGVTERKITLDYIISKHLSKPLNKTKKDVLTALRLGTYQILFMDKIPVSAAVNESVKLVKDNKAQYSAGLVNAVLRKVSRDDLIFDEKMSSAEKLSIEYSAPVELVNFLLHHYGEENTIGFLSSALKPKKISIKVNSAKISDDELVSKLELEGVLVEKTDIENALVIDTQGAVYELDCYKNGYFHVEDIASQLCVNALEVFSGATVIDVCAAPGGKSFAIAEKMNNQGTLYSCDIYESRVELIKQGAQRLGLDCINALVNDGTVFNEALPQMDRVLCDVPCSGLGIIGKKPEIKYKKLDDTKELIPVQKQILAQSSRYVKKGGRLVYSTCSVNPNENRRVCEAFLKENEDFSPVKVLPEIERTVDEGDYLTLFPHKNNCDGFFIAAFERK